MILLQLSPMLIILDLLIIIELWFIHIASDCVNYEEQKSHYQYAQNNINCNLSS